MSRGLVTLFGGDGIDVQLGDFDYMHVIVIVREGPPQLRWRWSWMSPERHDSRQARKGTVIVGRLEGDLNHNRGETGQRTRRRRYNGSQGYREASPAP